MHGDGAVQFAGPDKEALYSPWADFYGNVVVVRHAERDVHVVCASIQGGCAGGG